MQVEVSLKYKTLFVYLCVSKIVILFDVLYRRQLINSSKTDKKIEIVSNDLFALIRFLIQ
jgi:hypothetical protein